MPSMLTDPAGSEKAPVSARCRHPPSPKSWPCSDSAVTSAGSPGCHASPPGVSGRKRWVEMVEPLGKKKRQMFSKIWSLRKQLRSCLKEAAPATSGQISPSPHKFGRHAQLNVRSQTIKGLPPASQAHPKSIFQPYPLCLNMLNPTKI